MCGGEDLGFRALGFRWFLGILGALVGRKVRANLGLLGTVGFLGLLGYLGVLGDLGRLRMNRAAMGTRRLIACGLAAFGLLGSGCGGGLR